ncbi:hypothetical protein R6Q57_013182 [Mikania cordata]
MSGETPSNGAFKPRSALGDVTNQIGKRGFSLISTSGVKSGDDCKKDECIHFVKKECRRVDYFKKEKKNEEIAGCILRPHSNNQISSSKGDSRDGISKIACEIKVLRPPDARQNVTSTSSAGVDAIDVVGDSSQHTQLVHPIHLDDNGPDGIVETEEDERADSAVIPPFKSKEIGETSLGMDDGNDVSLDNLDSSKDGDLDFSRFLESQESKCGLEKDIVQTGDGLSSTCMDMIKACSCSFCMKAAYLWSDLLYQDLKGRIAASKKSQKEANILVNRNSRDIARNTEKFSNLESDLTGRWKSLFLHMEDIFVREGNQLDRSLSTLKELIDDC